MRHTFPDGDPAAIFDSALTRLLGCELRIRRITEELDATAGLDKRIGSFGMFIVTAVTMMTIMLTLPKKQYLQLLAASGRKENARVYVYSLHDR
ncbi:hypothetical protein BH18ACI5_BH18ACI5_07870 [soil metagenome]